MVVPQRVGEGDAPLRADAVVLQVEARQAGAGVPRRAQRQRQQPRPLGPDAVPAQLESVEHRVA